MKKTFKIFDSHADADRFVITQHLALTPAQRIELCCQISNAGWTINHPGQPFPSLRENVKISVRSLKNRDAK